MYYPVGDYDRGDTYGLRDLMLEGLHEGPANSTAIVSVDRGQGFDFVRTSNINAEETFSVDPEGAALILDLELPELIARHDSGEEGPTAAAWYYLRMGVISIAKGSEMNWAKIINRGAHWFRNNLHGEIDLQAVLQQSISESDHQALVAEHAEQMGVDKDKLGATQSAAKALRDQDKLAAMTDEQALSALHWQARRFLALGAAIEQMEADGEHRIVFDGLNLKDARNKARTTMQRLGREHNLDTAMIEAADTRALQDAQALVKQAQVDDSVPIDEGFGIYLGLVDPGRLRDYLDLPDPAQLDLFAA